MSELKAFDITLAEEGYCTGVVKYRKACYDKSEADKVIAHQKYKRCLAMAWFCSAELGMLVSTWESKIKHYKRWQRRWLELAEKFKEAK